MSRKTDMFNAELQRVIADIIRKIDDPRMKGMATVTNVNVSPDLKHAKVHVSVMGDADVKASTVEAIKSSVPMIKRELPNRIKVRSIPDLSIHLDNTLDEIDALNASIDNALKN